MGINVDYSFYRECYQGYLLEPQFLHLLPEAARHVDWVCGGRKPTRRELTCYKRAICATVDIFAEYGHGPAREYDLGRFHAGAASADRKQVTGENLATMAIEMELVTTSLLFGGVR